MQRPPITLRLTLSYYTYFLSRTVCSRMREVSWNQEENVERVLGRITGINLRESGMDYRAERSMRVGGQNYGEAVLVTKIAQNQKPPPKKKFSSKFCEAQTLPRPQIPFPQPSTYQLDCSAASFIMLPPPFCEIVALLLFLNPIFAADMTACWLRCKLQKLMSVYRV
jgi:hypothetical protein